jgi:hypothetical protein
MKDEAVFLGSISVMSLVSMGSISPLNLVYSHTHLSSHSSSFHLCPIHIHWLYLFTLNCPPWGLQLIGTAFVNLHKLLCLALIQMQRPHHLSQPLASSHLHSKHGSSLCHSLWKCGILGTLLTKKSVFPHIYYLGKVSLLDSFYIK